MNRAEVSPRNVHYIPKHRYYELKHFCLQYPEWERALDILDGWQRMPENLTVVDFKKKEPANPVEKIATARVFYSNRVKLIDDVLSTVNPSLSKYVKLGVTEGLPYEVLQARGCPCGRDMYYAEYRYFFWRLSIERQ